MWGDVVPGGAVGRVPVWRASSTTVTSALRQPWGSLPCASARSRLRPPERQGRRIFGWSSTAYISAKAPIVIKGDSSESDSTW